MNRLLSLALAAALLGASGGTARDPQAGAPRPAGTWRMTVDLGGNQSITFLLTLENANGQWSGKFLGASSEMRGENPTLEDVRVRGERLSFAIKLGPMPGQAMRFDGRLSPQGPIRGSIAAGENLLLTALEATNLSKFDRFELLKEVVATTDSVQLLAENAVDLLRLASANKAKPEDVRAWAERAAKAAEPYGILFQQGVTLRIVEALADQPEYGAVALVQAQRAERLLDSADDFTIQMPVLEALSKLLAQANKPDEVKEVAARIAKLEERDYQDYVKKFPFKPDAFAGRKLRGERAVLLELFTGAECAPCVAADLAFDALGMAYKANEVVRLQYHLHVPGPDPLSNSATTARAEYYATQIQGTPTSLFNGKEQAGGGGRTEAAQGKFLEYRKVVDAILETPARARLQISAQRTGDKIAINAKVGDLARPGDKLRLRVVLAEEVVRYRGGNGIRYHHHVVRAFAGGPDGFALKQGSSAHDASVDVSGLRKSLNDYLDKFQKENDGLTFSDRPMGLNKLVIVAFIQDDATKEVLQVAQVEVK